MAVRAASRDDNESVPMRANNQLSTSCNRIGVISDTHALMRPEALKALRCSDLIIHCGDIGDPSVLDALRAIAPVRAIRGNNDHGAWANRLPERDLVKLGNQSIYVLHNLNELELDLKASGVAAVVSGHSHKPGIERKGGILFLNPGSAGPRRFKLPTTVATIAVRPGRLIPRLLPLL